MSRPEPRRQFGGTTIEPGKLHGRRKGKPLSARREALIADRLPALAIDIAGPPPSRADLPGLFKATVERFRIEVGFGGGEHLLDEAAADPGCGFIGVEPFLNGLAKIVAGIEERRLENIRLFAGDAALLLDWLPEAAFGRLDLLYPDPWPKRRHWKRRFVSDANLDRIARVLAPGGEFRFASDIPHYVDWTLLHACRHPAFEWTAGRADDWRLPWPGWPGTRYEAKALREGRRPAYLVFRRI